MPLRPTLALSAACLALATATASARPASIDSAGARLPFVTHEAESPENTTTGRIVDLVPGATGVSPALEASGRAYVELDATGQRLDIPVTADADSIVLRNCIPDAPEGGGIEATLSLYVNGAFRQKLPLGSRHNWLYGQAGHNGQSNTPGPGAHVFWDEARALLQAPLKAGDTFSLRKDPDDTAAYYRLDLVDLELAGSPLPPPAPGTYVSVTDFGADGTDDRDDTAAILAAIATAKTQGKTVWIPAGTYRQSQRFILDGVAVRGAGPWHTLILGTDAGANWIGRMGFDLKGDGPQVRDLYLESLAHTARTPGGKPITGNARDWLVQNVWITHTNTGLWMSGASHGVVRDCRIRFTYADGINLNRGASHNLVENNHVRGCGDDGLAILSETERGDPPSVGNTLRNNTSSAIWWGHNADLAGGSGHLVENNLLADNALMGALTLNLTVSYPNHPLSDSVVRGNVLLRGGGNFANQRRGALWVFADSDTITDVKIEENLIFSPRFSGIQLRGHRRQTLIITGNTIENPGTDGIVIDSTVTGAGTFTGNTISGLGAGHHPFVNNAGPTYTTTLSGHSW